jgi:hypothetical protein
MLSETWRFTVVLKGAASSSDLSYVWSVEKAKIKEGQGTPSITIDRPDMQKGVIVVVEIGGLPQGCPNKASVSIIS